MTRRVEPSWTLERRPAAAARVAELLEQRQNLSINSMDGTGPCPVVDLAAAVPLRKVYESVVGSTVHGRYEVLRLLGHGGMAAVYHVRDLRPDGTRVPGSRARSRDDEYALKLFAPNVRARSPQRSSLLGFARSSSERTQRFIREFRMGQRALSRSGRIVNTFQFGSTTLDLAEDERPKDEDRQAVYYITMDLVRGGSLPPPTRPQPIESVVALALELLTALDELHGSNIVHRDLTFSNVLLEKPWTSSYGSTAEPGRVVLGDLGIAKHGAIRHDNPLGQILGTPEFMPPESLTLGNLDPRADLYAVGVILYWLAAGQHPLVAAGLPAAHAVSGGSYVLRHLAEVNPSCPPAVAAAVMGLLARQPAERPRTAALAHDLFAEWWKESGRADIPAAAPLRGSPNLAQPAFVGRQREVDRASQFLSATLNYRPPFPLTRDRLPADHSSYATATLPPSVMTIEASSGVGKSRLLSHILEDPSMSEAIVLRGQCASDGGAALHGVARILDDLVALSDAEFHINGERALGDGYAARLAALERVPSEEDEAFRAVTLPARDEEEERARAQLQRRLAMAQAAARLLVVCRQQPLVIVQEDSQWADESSAATLAYLMESVAIARAMGHPARVAFVLTHRHSQQGNAVARLLLMLNSLGELQRPAVRLDLEGMTRGEVTELCASMLQEPVDEKLAAFVQAVFPRDSSSPLYVEQVLRALLAEGVLTAGTFEEDLSGFSRWTGRWNLDPCAATVAHKPANVSEAIGVNVEQLSPGTATLLTYAAAEGTEFALDTVAQAAKLEPLECLDFLDEATGAGFVNDVESLDLSAAASRTANRRFLFRHDRFREAIYAASSEETRLHCHEELARATLALRGDLPENAEQLARHFAASGRFADASRYSTRAAEYASQERAYDHAVQLHEQAALFAGKALGVIPVELRKAIVKASVVAGLYDIATRQLSELTQLSNVLPQEKLAARFELAELEHRQQHYRKAVPPLREALEQLGDRLPPKGIRRRAIELGRLGRVVAAAACPSLVNTNSPANVEQASLRVRAWYSLGECLYFTDCEAVSFLTLTLGASAVRDGMHPSSPRAFASVGFGMATAGQHRLAREYMRWARRSMGLVEGRGRRIDPRERATVHMLDICVHLFGGQLAESYRAELERLVLEGLRAADECRDPQRLWTTATLVGGIHRQMGRIRTYERLINYVTDRATDSRLFFVARFHDLKLQTLLALADRDYEAAYKIGREGAQFARERGANTERAECSGNACWAGALLADARGECDQDVYETAIRDADAYLDLRLHDVAHWPLSQWLAALSLCRKHGAPLGPIRRLARRARAQCLRERKETPLYLAACAALDVFEHRKGAAGRGFEKAVETASDQGTVAQLLEVYRLGAAVYTSSTPEGEMYRQLDDELTRLVGAPSSLTLQELFAGRFAAPIQAPRPSYDAAGRAAPWTSAGRQVAILARGRRA